MNTHFELLGLPRVYGLNQAEVEANYLQRSQQVHPDFHQLGSTAERRASLDVSAAVNEAYHVLSDPFRRGEYLLALEGGPTAAEHRQESPEFLEEMLEFRMQIQQLHDTGQSAAEGSAEMNHLEAELLIRRDRLIEGIAHRFAEFEALPADDAGRPILLRQIRELLNTSRYIQGLLRDLQVS